MMTTGEKYQTNDKPTRRPYLHISVTFAVRINQRVDGHTTGSSTIDAHTETLRTIAHYTKTGSIGENRGERLYHMPCHLAISTVSNCFWESRTITYASISSYLWFSYEMFSAL